MEINGIRWNDDGTRTPYSINYIPDGKDLILDDGDTLVVIANIPGKEKTPLPEKYVGSRWILTNLKLLEVSVAKGIEYHSQLVQTQNNLVSKMNNDAKLASNKAIEASRKVVTITELAHQNNEWIIREGEINRAKQLAAAAEEEYKKAVENAKKAQKEYEAKKKEQEKIKKKQEETNRKLEEAKKKEQEEFDNLTIEEKKIVIGEKSLIAAFIKIKENNNNISNFNKKITALKAQISTLNSTLPAINKEVSRLKTAKKEWDLKLSNALKGGMMNDPNRYRLFQTIKSNSDNVNKALKTQQEKLTSTNNQINKLEKDLKGINNQLSIEQDKKLESEKEYRNADQLLSETLDSLSFEKAKEYFDDALKYGISVTEHFKEKYKQLVEETTKLVKSKKIKDLKHALEVFEKDYLILKKKFSAKDLEAISNALKVVEYKHIEEELKKYIKTFKITAEVSNIYETVKALEYGIDTGDWNPLFNKAKNYFVGMATAYLVGVIIIYVSRVSTGVVINATQKFILTLIVESVVNYIVDNYVMDKVGDLADEMKKLIN